MKTSKFIYGWQYGGKDCYQQYVYQNKKTWGVTKNPAEAKVFKSIQECQEHWKSKHWPGEFENCITNGYLQYFNARTFQMIII